MLEALKILFLLIYFVALYLISESFLVALSVIPLFVYIKLSHKDLRKTWQTILTLMIGFLLPALVSVFFSFTPSHWDQDKTLAAVLSDAGLIGLFSAMIVALYKVCELTQLKRENQKPRVSLKNQQGLALLAIPLLLPLLIWMHTEYKIFQEQSFDKLAYALLTSLTTAQESALSEYGAYQKDLKRTGFTPGDNRDVYDIFLTSDNLPLEYVEVIPQAALPFVEKKSYQAILALRNPVSRSIKFFYCNDKKEIRQIKVQIPFKKTHL